MKRYYAQATSHLPANKIHFEYHTRVFVVHESFKNGPWQDPREQRGAKKHGILGEIEFRRGRYGGAALAPQVFEKPYFRILLLAPYSEECDCHSYTHLACPPTTDPKFLREFQTRVQSFFEKPFSAAKGNSPVGIDAFAGSHPLQAVPDIQLQLPIRGSFPSLGVRHQTWHGEPDPPVSGCSLGGMMKRERGRNGFDGIE